MDNTSNDHIVNIIKSAVNEFFLPITKVRSSLKKLVSRSIEEEKIIERLHKLEISLTESIGLQVEATKSFERLNKSVQLQKDLITKLNNNFSYINKYVSSQSFMSEALEDYSNTLKSNISKIVDKSRDLRIRRLVPGNELTMLAAELGLANIEYILSGIVKNKKKTPYLFGINKGGAFLANYLAHRLELDQKYLVKCDYNIEYDKIYCENRDIDSPIVIIDDVVRTGRTIEKIREYLGSQYPASKIYSIALVVSCEKKLDHEKLFEFIDYSPWVSNFSKVTLPWSKVTVSDNESGMYFNDKEMDQVVGRIGNE